MDDTLRSYINILNESSNERVDELDPFGGIARATDTVKAKFGSKEAKMTQVARDNALAIWDKWNKSSTTGGVSATIENIVNWLNKEEIDTDVIDVAFKGIGVNDISSYITQEEPEAADSALMSWLEDEMIQPTAFSGNTAKEFLLAKGVPEERADTMLDRIGLKVNGASISPKKHSEKLDIIAKKFGSDTQDGAAAVEGEPTDVWPASKVYNYVLNKYDTDEEMLKAAFETLGTSSTSKEPMGDEAFRRLMTRLEDFPKKETEAPQGTEAVMDKTQEILKGAGASVGQAKTAGQKAVNSGNYAGMTELQKLGIAILTARKKI